MSVSWSKRGGNLIPPLFFVNTGINTTINSKGILKRSKRLLSFSGPNVSLRVCLFVKIVIFESMNILKNYGPNGYPTKRFIRRMVKEYNKALAPYGMGVNPLCVTFSGAYGEEGKSSGILWKAKESMLCMDGFDSFLMDHGVKIKRVKYWGRIHSIWYEALRVDGLGC